MELYKTLEELSDKVSKLRNHVATEEATKTAFVLPFLVSLGYDIYNPLEVIPEMDCDISRRGDKVDYAINIDSKPVMIVECKQCEKNLDAFALQLAKYYVATKARFAILTNGIEYRFFSDMDRVNLMDSKPFFVFDISSFDKHDVELLGRFQRNCFDERKIIQIAENINIEEKVRTFLENEVFKCSDTFAKYIADSIGCSYSVDEVARVVRNQINDRLSIPQPKGDKPSPIVNGEDYKAYLLVKKILKHYAYEDEIKYTSFKSYFTINKHGSVWRWIVRIKRTAEKVKVCFPMNDYKTNEWVTLDSIDDLSKMSDRIIQSFRMASFEKSYGDSTNDNQNVVKHEKTANEPQV